MNEAPRASPAPPQDDGSVSRHVAESASAVAALHRDHDRAATRIQRAINRATDLIGRPAFVIGLFLLILAWAAAALAGGGRVDQPAFAWLELAGTLGALLISTLILVTQRHDDQLAERRAKLTLELALLADRKAAKIIALLEELRRDQPELADRVDRESEAMSTAEDPEAILAALDKRASD